MNEAVQGYIDVKLLEEGLQRLLGRLVHFDGTNLTFCNEELFSPDYWTLKSKSRPDEDTDFVDFGIYTISANMGCTIKPSDEQTVSKIWFSTPVRAVI